MSTVEWTVVNANNPGSLIISSRGLEITVDRDLAVSVVSEMFGVLDTDARTLIAGAEKLKEVLAERYGEVI